MEKYLYFKLSDPIEGTWPSTEAIQPGGVIRIPIYERPPVSPTNVFNEETKEWATAFWYATTDPARSDANVHV